MLPDCLARADERRARPNVREAISEGELEWWVGKGSKLQKLCDSKVRASEFFISISTVNQTEHVPYVGPITQKSD